MLQLLDNNPLKKEQYGKKRNKTKDAAVDLF